jgi:hypothetical protein
MPERLTGLRAFARRHALFLIGLGLAFTFVRWPSFTGWDDCFYVAQLTSAVTWLCTTTSCACTRPSRPSCAC